MHKLGNFLTIGGLVGVTVVSGAALSSLKVSATGTASGTETSTATVTVSEACSMTATVDTAHTATLPSGVYSGGSSYYPNGIGQTTIKTFCNDPSGYSIYAVGFTGDDTSGNNTVLHSSVLGDEKDIVTGTATEGNTSNWAMKLSAVSGTYAPSILNGYGSYSAVPASYTKVATFGGITDATAGSSLTTTYAAYISGTQPAGTYVGKVKYTLVHPAAEDVPDADTMQNVAYWGAGMAVGEEKTVTDSRDGNTYTVARLCTSYSGSDCAESQIWMTQNLDLKLSPSTPLTSLNTDLNTAYAADGTTLFQGYSMDGSIVKWTPNSTLATPATISDFDYHNAEASNVSGWKNEQYVPHQAEGQLGGNDAYIYTSGSSSRDTVYGTLAACTGAGHTAAECAHYKIGNYYNFTAANAMNDSTGYTSQYSVLPNSICPRGWRLPTGITNGGTTMSEFNKLLIAQGVTNGTDLAGSTNTGYADGGLAGIRGVSPKGQPLYFVRAGGVDGTTLWSSTENGHYWSSTVATPGTIGYDLNFHSGGVWPANQVHRYNGGAVRCVAR